VVPKARGRMWRVRTAAKHEGVGCESCVKFVSVGGTWNSREVERDTEIDWYQVADQEHEDDSERRANRTEVLDTKKIVHGGRGTWARKSR
jgi:hypothetical protein